ncbi:MAG: efflux RND transporter permease subunit, partial [Cyanobacteria bacterium P01_H01_bin.58]
MARFNLDRIRSHFNISRLAIQNSWLTVCCWLAIAVAGFFAFSSLKYALFPDITFPVVVVSATTPIETTVETETQLTAPLETELQPLEDLRRMASSTTAGRTVMNLRFRVGTQLAAATAAVEEALAQADLPAEADYEATPLNLNEATAVSYALTSADLTLADLDTLATTDMLPQLQDIPGVLRVDLLGTGTTADGEDEDTDTGFLEGLNNAPTLVHFDGEAALALQVVKQGEANTLDVVDRVETTIQALREAFPNVELTLAATQADYIRAATQATIDSLLGAIVIAVLVILLFLRSWRATLITALAIPLSLLGTFIVMAIYGFNLETITLLALALVIGIIVDDAIVEIENIVRHMELGATPRQAAFRATEEIGLTVSASTLTIVAVFLPVAFMGGTVGQFFKPFGLTVSVAVLTSLLVARTLSPVLAAYWLRQKAASTAKPLGDHPLPGSQTVDSETLPTSGLDRIYKSLLSWALHHRWIVVILAIASFAAGLAIIPAIPQGFIPQLDRGEFYLNYASPLPALPIPGQLPEGQGQAPGQQQPPTDGTSALDSLPDPRSLILQSALEDGEALEVAVFDLPEVEAVLTTVGNQGRPNQGSLYIRLRDDRDRDTAAVQAQLRQDLPALEGVTTSVEDIQFIDTGGEKPLQVALLGDDLEALRQAVTDIKAEVEELPGFADVRVSGEDNTAGEIVEINRQNGQRVAYVSANLTADKGLGDATDEVVAIAASIIPAGIEIDLGGDSARIGEVLGTFGRTLAFAILCMLAVLMIPFGRLLEPAVVGLSLPFSVVGAMLALLLTRSDFGIVSLLGLLFLLGLLDKNALLLMDYANQLRRAGMKRTEAVLKTGMVRLRPILMTTA